MSRQASTSSGTLSADAAVWAQPGKLAGVILLADGTNAATVTIYDNASAASGTVLATLKVKATDVFASWEPSEGVVANNGLYADVTGTGASYIVHYFPG